MSNNIELSQWSAQAAAKWRQWWLARLELCGLTRTSLAKASCADEAERSVANNLTLLLDGDLRGLRRYFHPAPQSQKSARDRLDRLALAISLPADPVFAADLGRLVDRCQQPDLRSAVSEPWHPAFPSVPTSAVSVPVPVPQWQNWGRDAEPTTMADWLSELAKKPEGNSKQVKWLWIVGEPGSGRKSLVKQLQAEWEHRSDLPPTEPPLWFDRAPADGYGLWRERNPMRPVVAICARSDLPNRQGEPRDLEWHVMAWTHGQVAEAAAQLAAGDFVDDASRLRLETFAAATDADPELLGPDKRPVAVIGLLAAVVAGQPIANPEQAREQYRERHVADVRARLCAASPLAGGIKHFLMRFWALRLASSERADWIAMTHSEAEHLAERAAEPLWGRLDRARAGELLRALDQGKPTAGELRHRVAAAKWACLASAADLIDELVAAGEFVVEGDTIRAANPTAALVLATAQPPVGSVAPAVLAMTNSLGVAREWALSGVDADDVVRCLSLAPEPQRPFAWYWLLAFAWERRTQLSHAWVKRNLEMPWAGAVAATLLGYGDMDVYQVFHGRQRNDELTSLLVRVSLHWSGVLPDLDAARPWEDLCAKVPANDMQLVMDWLDLRKRVRGFGHWQVGAQWLPPPLYTVRYRQDLRSSEANDNDLRDAANEVLWWLAPGQLLGLADGAALAEARIFEHRLDERVHAAVRRADAGDEVMQAWLAGEHLLAVESAGCPAIDHRNSPGVDIWCSAPVADHLKWLRVRARGAEREVAVLLEALSLRGSTEAHLAVREHWPVLCAILEAQPRARLHELVAATALPWWRSSVYWFGIPRLPCETGLTLAERFGFDDLLVQAQEAPHRWLEGLRLVRICGELALCNPEPQDGLGDWRRRFGAGPETWDGFRAADAFAHQAAKALHRRGQPEALRRRAMQAPDWPVGAELLADWALLARPTHKWYPQADANDALPGDAVTSELSDWLKLARQRAKLRLDDPPLFRGGLIGRRFIDDELGKLVELVECEDRFEVAADKQLRWVRAGEDNGDTAQRFWQWAAQPRPLALDRGQRLRVVIGYALWLWAERPLPKFVAAFDDGSALRSVSNVPAIAFEETELAPWQIVYPLRKIALDAAERAIATLVELGEIEPLRRWATGLPRQRCQSDDWFADELQERLTKHIKDQPHLHSRAVAAVLDAPLPANPLHLPIANQVLNCVLPYDLAATEAWPAWLQATLLPNHPEIAWRYLSSASSRLSAHALVLLREVYALTQLPARKIWIALQIERLGGGAEFIQDHVHRWLTSDPEPFVGAPTAERCASPLQPGGLGFKDLLEAARKVFKTGILAGEDAPTGVLRLARLASRALDGFVDPVDGRQAFRHWSADQTAAEVLAEERTAALRELPKAIVEFAAEVGSVALARQAVAALGRFGVMAESAVPSLPRTNEELVATLAAHDPALPFDMEQAREPDYAAQDLLARGAELEAVGVYVRSRLRQGVAQAGSETELAYLLGLLAPLGQSAWLAGVELLPFVRRREVLAESLAQGFARSMSDLALAIVLDCAEAESTASAATESPSESNGPQSPGQTP